MHVVVTPLSFQVETVPSKRPKYFFIANEILTSERTLVGYLFLDWHFNNSIICNVVLYRAFDSSKRYATINLPSAPPYLSLIDPSPQYPLQVLHGALKTAHGTGKPMIPESLRKRIFLNISEIHTLNADFLEELETRIQSW